MKKHILSIACTLVLALPSSAQEFVLTSIEQTNTRIVVHYDLIDSTSNRLYTVRLYSSADNFINPLNKVTGDVGLEVKPGKNKSIVWDAKEELGPQYRGDIELEVKGKAYVPFITFNDFKTGRVFKRGKKTTLTWSGG